MTTNIQPSSTPTLYERDFYLWIQKTAQLLKEHRFDEIDLENLVEEIEAMGRTEKKEVKSRLVTVIEHLLKLMYWEPEKAYNARGWRNTIVEQRRQIELSLEDSPSLKLLLDDMFLDCYRRARKEILQKNKLPSEMFPIEPPFTLEDVLNPDYLPE